MSDGITWLDWIMSALTIIGLVATWWKARGAMKAANQTKQAIIETAGDIGRSELIASLGVVRELVRDLDSAIQANSVPVSSHVLVKLGKHLADVVALAEKLGGNIVSAEVVSDMKLLIPEAATVKRRISKTPNAKVMNHTQVLEEGLENLIQRFSVAEVEFKYSKVRKDQK
ncbi:hypothetical protein [Leucobacter sp. W1038]|uniref:hypothetical protein n=1 Tax=Leucobacter sp. W1038 TaxID=3438281 RepID=UPI003D97A337